MSKVKELILEGLSFLEAVKEANVEVKSNDFFITKNEQDAIYIFNFLSSILMKNKKVEMRMTDEYGLARYIIERKKI